MGNKAQIQKSKNDPLNLIKFQNKRWFLKFPTFHYSCGTDQAIQNWTFVNESMQTCINYTLIMQWFTWKWPAVLMWAVFPGKKKTKTINILNQLLSESLPPREPMGGLFKCKILHKDQRRVRDQEPVIETQGEEKTDRWRKTKREREYTD